MSPRNGRCVVCGKPSGSRQYCGDRCRQRAHRKHPDTERTGISEATQTDIRNVTLLERLWALHRSGDEADIAELLPTVPEIVKARFLKDRAKGYSSS